MTEGVQIALIAAFAALASVVISGVFAYLLVIRKRRAESNKRRLEAAYRDIIAFHQIEEAYALALSTTDRSAEAVKREFRKALRDGGGDSPSKDATPAECKRRLQELQDA